MIRRSGGFKLILLSLGVAELYTGNDSPPTSFTLGNLHQVQGRHSTRLHSTLDG